MGEDPGYSPFTAAVEIAGLLAAADLAEAHREPVIASYLRDAADAWNASVEPRLVSASMSAT